MICDEVTRQKLISDVQWLENLLSADLPRALAEAVREAKRRCVQTRMPLHTRTRNALARRARMVNVPLPCAEYDDKPSTKPLPDWMLDSSLLPKRPPGRS